MANMLTVLRMLLAVVAIEFIFTGRPDMCFSALLITILVILLDGLDGIAARAMNEVSEFGSVFDIIGDRVVENLYWIAFAVVGWVPVWVPMVVVTRGIITDGLRSIALSKGYTAFGSSSMMKNKFCHFLTASRLSRAVYGIAKVLAFILVIIAYMPNIQFFDIMTIDDFVRYSFHRSTLMAVADTFVYIAAAMCIIRGIPVIVESKRFLNNDKE